MVEENTYVRNSRQMPAAWRIPGGDSRTGVHYSYTAGTKVILTVFFEGLRIL